MKVPDGPSNPSLKTEIHSHHVVQDIAIINKDLLYDFNIMKDGIKSFSSSILHI